METNEQGETPTGGEMPQTSETPATPVAKPETPAQPPAETSDEYAALRQAIEKERELRKAAEAQVKKTTRTAEERIADLEARNQKFEIERQRDKVLDAAIAEVTRDGHYTVNRNDVLELLEDVNLTEATVEAAVKKRVEKLKRNAPVITPNNATPKPSEGKPVKAGLDNPYAGF